MNSTTDTAENPEDCDDKGAVEEEPVDWETSRAMTDLLAGQAAMFRLLPLEQLDALYRLADSAGAIFDPTGYRAHHRSIDAARRIVAAARRFEREVADAIRDAVP